VYHLLILSNTFYIHLNAVISLQLKLM